MSEEMETQSATMDSMLDAIHQKNLAQARAHFDGIMADKIGDALEHEKINIAAQFYGTAQPESEVPQEDETEASYDEAEYDEYEASAEESDETEEDWSDLEAELESSFEENEEEEELEV